jgi:GNAT superfamily N-acetyltransferase
MRLQAIRHPDFRSKFDFSPIIRRLRREDISVVVAMSAELAGDCDTAPLDIAMLERDALGQAPTWHVLVAESEGRLIGYGLLHKLERAHSGRRELELQHIFIIAPWRGKGVGGWLLNQAAGHARHLGCHDLTVSTAADVAAARDFYMRCGFRPGPVARYGKVVSEPLTL